MEFFIVDNENEIEVTNKTLGQILVETVQVFPYMQAKDLEIILPKFKAIAENLQALKEQAIIEGARSKLKDRSDLFVIQALEINNCNRVELDESNAYDEFYLAYSKGKYLPNSCCNVEVVTKEVAEENDMEWLKAGSTFAMEEIKKNYKVGEVLSDYRRLGNSEYYFKFM